MPENDPPTLRAALAQIARERFGYDKLFSDQEQVIRLLLQGHDVLAVLPTGGGKSAIYQIAGLMLAGSTVVVSPLIALQADQLAHIEEADLPDAAVLNSHTPASQRAEIFDRLARDELEYLFLAPEQLLNEETLMQLREHPPSLFVVDEAHCVSEWGHDFRPDYAKLDKVLDAFSSGKQRQGRRGRPRVLALTATASPKVREDILSQLAMVNPRVHVANFDRPEILLAAEVCPDSPVKDRLLPERVHSLMKEFPNEGKGNCCGIVYVATQANTEHVATLLREHNVAADVYHGGMSKGDRRERQEAFMSGELPVMVATNAFGMGVDKPDVRWVVHYDVPDSLDSYMQEIGRAGRDGKPAGALLFFTDADLGRQKAMSAPVRLEADAVADAFETVRSDGTTIDPATLSEETDQAAGRLNRTLQLLEAADVVRVDLDGVARVTAEGKKADPSEVADVVVEQQQRFRDWRSARLEAMAEYARSGACRRRLLLEYFEQPAPEACGRCDNCLSGRALREEDSSRQKEATTDERQPYPVGASVRHAKFGRGNVERYAGQNVVILFEDVGRKEIAVDFAQENDLLEPGA